MKHSYFPENDFLKKKIFLRDFGVMVAHAYS